MSDLTSRALAVPARRLARAAVRFAALTLGRVPMLKRHLLRLRFGPWATRWLGGRAVVAWRGVRVEVDPAEAHGFHVFVHGDYGGAELDACIEVAADARVFVDVGAHIGLFSLAVARACPTLQVVAIEADRDIAAWFKRNLALNPDLAPRVTLVEAAAAERDGEVTFETSRGPANVGTGHVTGGTAAPGRAVPAVALGPWLAARQLRADVVKIDVEGGELDVLAGLWMAGPPPEAILLETHGHMFPDPAAFDRQVLRALDAHGYAVERLDRGVWTRLTDVRHLGGRTHLRARRAARGLV